MKKIKEIVEAVRLEEMDWQQTKETAKQNIRQALVMLECNRHLLALAEEELRSLWVVMNEEERKKREQND